jgi:hypothetical protein
MNTRKVNPLPKLVSVEPNDGECSLSYRPRKTIRLYQSRCLVQPSPRKVFRLASGIHFLRIRPIFPPVLSTATAIKALASVGRPIIPSSSPPPRLHQRQQNRSSGLFPGEPLLVGVGVTKSMPFPNFPVPTLAVNSAHWLRFSDGLQTPSLETTS